MNCYGTVVRLVHSCTLDVASMHLLEQPESDKLQLLTQAIQKLTKCSCQKHAVQVIQPLRQQELHNAVQ